jgi:nucleoid-associated protein YgaU
MERKLTLVSVTVAVGLALVFLPGCQPKKTAEVKSPDVVATTDKLIDDIPPDSAANPPPVIPNRDNVPYTPPPSAPDRPTRLVPNNVAVAPGQTYTVQAKDTLSSICRKLYGDTKKVHELAKLNNLTDPNKLKVGQVLKLP